MFAEITPIIDYSVRGLCKNPYHNHPKGCPNWGKDKCPPIIAKLEDFFDTTQPMYFIWNEFDLGSHIEKMKEKHPDWTDYQLRCVLYWQPKARKQLKEEIIKFKKLHPEYFVSTGPEAMGQCRGCCGAYACRPGVHVSIAMDHHAVRRIRSDFDDHHLSDFSAAAPRFRFLYRAQYS